jgi:hypothetical protein
MKRKKHQPSAFWKKASLILGTLVLAAQLLNQVTALVPTISRQIAFLQGPPVTRAQIELLRDKPQW